MEDDMLLASVTRIQGHTACSPYCLCCYHCIKLIEVLIPVTAGFVSSLSHVVFRRKAKSQGIGNVPALGAQYINPKLSHRTRARAALSFNVQKPNMFHRTSASCLLE